MPCNVSVRGAFQLTPSARRATYQLRLARERTDYFNPRPPRGGRPVAFGFSHIRVLISIHALREEGDVIATAPAGWIWDFNPRPPRGERQRMISDIEDMMQISIHALREESDLQKQGYKRRMVISIHALREEGDRVLPLLCMLHKIFRSTPSARWATRPSPASRRSSTYFNPRPPRGGRLVVGNCHVHVKQFQSTPSARRATRVVLIINQLIIISIHALREEGDTVLFRICAVLCNFNPRPPRGGRLTCAGNRQIYRKISIHALREEGDQCRPAYP